MIRYLYYVYFIANFKVIASNMKPNIIMILSDDQDVVLGGMTPLKSTIKTVANQGITLQNAFVNAPICCPSRSSILTGRYPHNTNVVNNSVSGNCASNEWRQNIEPFSIAPFLQKNSYNTFYAGKYLNQYGEKATGFQNNVPPGWSSWFGLVGNSKYYNYTLVENGKRVRYKNAYLTDVLIHKAKSFLEVNLKSYTNPLFMIIAPPAPHAPFMPAERHKNLFPKEKALRTPAFNCTGYKKHWLMRMRPKNLPSDVTRLNKIQQHRFEALLAVDELVETVITQLKIHNQLNNTYIIYTSDNGYHIGQFSQPWDKRQPYDTDIRVPLLIRGPNIPSKIVSALPIQSIDLYPTILQMANVSVPDFVDGKSFLNHIQNVENNDSDSSVHKNILIEYHGEGNPNSNDENCPWGKDPTLSECGIDSWCKCQDSINNTYNCVRSLAAKENFLFCRFKDNENYVEAYDLMRDKYELNNIYDDMTEEEISKYNVLLEKLILCKGLDCRNIE